MSLTMTVQAVQAGKDTANPMRGRACCREGVVRDI